MAPINPTFSRFKFAPKRGSVLKYIKNQGYVAVPAPKPKAPAAPGGGLGQQQPFDYGKALQGEGVYQYETGQNLAGAQSAQAQRDAAAKALGFQYNDPSNPFATTSELERARSERVANMLSNRAARGVVQSGGTTLGQLDVGHDYSKALYDAGNQYSSALGSLDQNLADKLRQYGFANANALKDATGRLIEGGVGPAAGSPGGVPAPNGTGVNSPEYKAAALAVLQGKGTPEQVALWRSAPDASYQEAMRKKNAEEAASRAANPNDWIKGKDGRWMDLRGTTPEVRRQAALNAQGYDTYFAGSPEETYRRLKPGQQYTWEMHLQDLVKSGKAKALPGFDYKGVPLPGRRAARLRAKAGY